MSTSVLRSVKRAVSQAVGPDWELRLGVEEWAAFSRPTGRLYWATAGTTSPHGATHRDHRRTVAVALYPVAGINGESSLLEAERVAGIVQDVFARGVDPEIRSSRNERRAHPLRMAVYDYDGIGLHEPGPAEPVGMAQCEPPSVEVIRDEASDLHYSVVATAVLRWSEGLLRPANHPVESVLVGQVRSG